MSAEDDPENARIASEISSSEAAVIAAPSIAAPFATGLHHIGAVSIVVTEGRGTLATSFTMYDIHTPTVLTFFE